MFTWIFGVAAGCVVLAFVMHFLVPAKGVKVPAVVLGTVGGFAAGAAAGLLGAVIYGESVQSAMFAADHTPEPMGGARGAPTGPGNMPAPKKRAQDAPKKAATKSLRPEGYPAPDEPKKDAPPAPKADEAKG